MKKLFILAIVLSLFLFGCSKGDVGSKGNLTITGNVVDVVVKESCEDSDNGIDTSVKGTVRVIDENGNSHEDSDKCIAGLLIEYYCEGNKKSNQNIRCSNICKDGKCI